MQHADKNLAVIADDLTGACDTACQFALYGFRPLVLQALTGSLPGNDPLVVLNTDSRKEDAAIAYQRVLELCRSLKSERFELLYKKIDSTLKGNWVAELSAMVKVTQAEVVVVAPAFPEWGRTTLDGIQLCHGRPVTEVRSTQTATEAPPASGPADLVASLHERFGRRICHFRRPFLKKGPAVIAKQMESASFRGFQIQVFDAVTDDDLKTIALAGCRLEQRVLWTGSAGLARFLPPAWGYPMQPANLRLTQAVQPVLVISGSLNPANAEQLERLKESASASLLWIEDEDSDNSAQTLAKADQVLSALKAGRNAAMSVRLHKPIRSAAHLQNLQDALQSCAIRCLQAGLISAAVIVGGDTAMNLYRKIGASALRIEGEVQPGIPCGRWVGGFLDGQPLVTKAGGFGEADTLVKAVAFLTGERRFATSPGT